MNQSSKYLPKNLCKECGKLTPSEFIVQCDSCHKAMIRRWVAAQEKSCNLKPMEQLYE